MKRMNFLYAAFSGLLIFSLFSFLELEKATGAIIKHDKAENPWILNQWVVAEAVNPEDGKDVTSLHSSEVWYFLKSNGFVLFSNQIIEKNGSWGLKNDSLHISTGEQQDPISFKVEKKSRNELVLLNQELKIRLLKLDLEDY